MPPWKSVQTLNAGAFMASNLSNTPSEILRVQYQQCKQSKKTQCWFSKIQTRVMSKSQSSSVWLISWEVDYLQPPLVTDALASTHRPLILEQFHPCFTMQTCTLHSQTRMKIWFSQTQIPLNSNTILVWQKTKIAHVRFQNITMFKSVFSRCW